MFLRIYSQEKLLREWRRQDRKGEEAQKVSNFCWGLRLTLVLWGPWSIKYTSKVFQLWSKGAVLSLARDRLEIGCGNVKLLGTSSSLYWEGCHGLSENFAGDGRDIKLLDVPDSVWTRRLQCPRVILWRSNIWHLSGKACRSLERNAQSW